MDQSVRVWPIERMGSSTELIGHTGRVDQTHWFLNDDNLLLSGSSDASVRFWDLRTNANVANIAVGGDNLHMSMSPCGKYIATSSSQDMLSLIDLRTKRVYYSAKARYELNQHSWDRTGALFCIANGLGQVVLHSFNNTDRPIEKLGLIQAHTGNCFCLQFAKSGRYFLSAAADATAVLWDVEDVVPLRSYAHCSSKIRAVGFSYDSKYIALGSEDDVVHVVEVGSGDRVARVATDNASTVSLDWHPSKHILAFSGAQNLLPSPPSPLPFLSLLLLLFVGFFFSFLLRFLHISSFFSL